MQINAETQVSQQVLAAALAGLMGVTIASCGKEKEKIVEVAAAAPSVTSTSTDKTMTLAKFTSDCTTRGGLIQTHASCAGNNSCKGISFHSESGKLSEHTCKALNICSGMSCIELPKDSNLSGAEILAGSKDGTMVGAETQCNFCHSPDTKADPNVDPKSFKLPIAPSIEIAAGLAAFKSKSDAAVLSAIAFGLHGVNSNGTAYTNMPAFYTSYSLAEMNRLVTHIRSLPVQGVHWEDPK